MFFFDDDIAHPDLLKLTVEQLEHSNLDYARYLREVFTGKFNINYDRSLEFNTCKLDISDLEGLIMGKIPFNSCEVLLRRHCFSNHGSNEKLMYVEEWQFYARILH